MGAVPTVLVILPTATYRAPDFVRAAVRPRIGSGGGQRGRPRARRSDGGRVPGDRLRGIPRLPPSRSWPWQHTANCDAVVAADDQGVVIAALAAERLGLPHNPPDAARATRDKAVMRTLLAAAGVPQPRFEILRGLRSRGDAGSGSPCVVKPLSLSGSRGRDPRRRPRRRCGLPWPRIRGILRRGGGGGRGAADRGGVPARGRGGRRGPAGSRRTGGAGDPRQAGPAGGAVLRGDHLRDRPPGWTTPPGTG